MYRAAKHCLVAFRISGRGIGQPHLAEPLPGFVEQTTDVAPFGKGLFNRKTHAGVAFHELVEQNRCPHHDLVLLPDHAKGQRRIDQILKSNPAFDPFLQGCAADDEHPGYAEIEGFYPFADYQAEIRENAVIDRRKHQPPVTFRVCLSLPGMKLSLVQSGRVDVGLCIYALVFQQMNKL